MNLWPVSCCLRNRTDSQPCFRLRAFVFTFFNIVILIDISQRIIHGCGWKKIGHGIYAWNLPVCEPWLSYSMCSLSASLGSVKSQKDWNSPVCHMILWNQYKSIIVKPQTKLGEEFMSKWDHRVANFFLLQLKLEITFIVCAEDIIICTEGTEQHFGMSNHKRIAWNNDELWTHSKVCSVWLVIRAFAMAMAPLVPAETPWMLKRQAHKEVNMWEKYT